MAVHHRSAKNLTDGVFGMHPVYVGNKYTWEHFCDASDARVLAEQQIWASVTNKANNEAFNCTNGDVFTWKMIWRVLCDAFDIEFVPFDEKEEFDLVEFMKDKGEVWDRIVEENGLYKTKMEEIAYFNGIDKLLQFEFQHVCSVNKSREFGFHGYANTLKSIPEWVQKLRQMKILP
ncbi:putative (S)-8-oxocitronellyl enol synthase [Helianthus debilis subsp. tardiflorus]